MHPERSGANFFICMALLSGAMNQVVMKSNWDVLATIWDGVNSKNLGYPEQYFFYYPWPPILNTLFAAPRDIWTQRLTSLTVGKMGQTSLTVGKGGRFYINHQETPCEKLNELFGRDIYVVPNSEQILKAQIPNIKENRNEYIFPETDKPIPPDVKGGTYIE